MFWVADVVAGTWISTSIHTTNTVVHGREHDTLRSTTCSPPWYTYIRAVGSIYRVYTLSTLLVVYMYMLSTTVVGSGIHGIHGIHDMLRHEGDVALHPCSALLLLYLVHQLTANTLHGVHELTATANSIRIHWYTGTSTSSYARYCTACSS